MHIHSIIYYAYSIIIFKENGRLLLPSASWEARETSSFSSRSSDESSQNAEKGEEAKEPSANSHCFKKQVFVP
jgi:hypothetical protein